MPYVDATTAALQHLSLTVSARVCSVALLMLIVCCGGSEQRSYAPVVAGQPQLYSSEPVRTVVVDAQTREPIGGAAVVVLWRKIGAADGRWAGIHRIVETQTADDGSFVVHRWGPRPVDGESHLDRRDPEIWVLRRGYLVGYFDNTGALEPRVFSAAVGSPRISKWAPAETGSRSPGAFRRSTDAGSIWNGRTLALHRGEPAAVARSLEAAAPLDTYEAAPPPLPLFWNEWTAARGALGPSWQSRVEQPLPLMQQPGKSHSPVTAGNSK